MKKVYLLLIVLSFVFIGCDASIGKLKALGYNANVKCYSGGVLTYEGISTGRVQSSEQSDGYYFVDESDRKLKEVSGECIITYGE